MILDSSSTQSTFSSVLRILACKYTESKIYSEPWKSPIHIPTPTHMHTHYWKTRQNLKLWRWQKSHLVFFFNHFFKSQFSSAWEITNCCSFQLGTLMTQIRTPCSDAPTVLAELWVGSLRALSPSFNALLFHSPLFILSFHWVRKPKAWVLVSNLIHWVNWRDRKGVVGA